MIRPLDLQMLYMNLEKVSKEATLSKEAAAQAQANQVEKLQKEHDAGQHSVGRTAPTDGDDAELRVQADGHSGGSGQNEPRPPAENAQPELTPEEKARWEDPELGRHVDLSG